MKKETINMCYQFLGTNVKVGSLKNAETRSTFIRFFRELRKIAVPILDEIQAANQPPLDEATAETVKQILSEEYEGTLPKISDDIIIELLAESGIDVPLAAVMNTFDGFLENG